MHFEYQLNPNDLTFPHTIVIYSDGSEDNTVLYNLTRPDPRNLKSANRLAYVVIDAWQANMKPGLDKVLEHWNKGIWYHFYHLPDYLDKELFIRIIGKMADSKPVQTKSNTHCKRCNYPYPYGEGPEICSGCKCWEAIT